MLSKLFKVLKRKNDKPSTNQVDDLENDNLSIKQELISLIFSNTDMKIKNIFISGFNSSAITKKELNTFLDTVYERLVYVLDTEFHIENKYIEIRRALVGFFIYNVVFTNMEEIEKCVTIKQAIFKMFKGDMFSKLNSIIRTLLEELHMYSNLVERLNKTTKYFLVTIYIINILFKEKEVLNNAVFLNTRSAILYFILLTSKFYFNKDCKEEYDKFTSIVNSNRKDIDNILSLAYDSVFIKYAKAKSYLNYFSIGDLVVISSLDVSKLCGNGKKILSDVAKFNVYSNVFSMLNNYDHINDCVHNVVLHSELDYKEKIDMETYLTNSPYYKYFKETTFSRLFNPNEDLEIIAHNTYEVRDFILTYLKLDKLTQNYGVIDVRPDSFNLNILSNILIAKEKFKLNEIIILINIQHESDVKICADIFNHLLFIKLKQLRYTSDLYKNVKVVIITNKSLNSTHYNFSNVVDLRYPVISEEIAKELKLEPNSLTLNQYVGIEERLTEMLKYKDTYPTLYENNLAELCRNYNLEIPDNKDEDDRLEKDDIYDVEFINIKDNDINSIINKTMSYVNKSSYINLSFLLHGISGTGKTMFANELAEALDFKLKTYSASSILSKWVGETEENIYNIFSNNKEDTIILIEEAESLFVKRDNVQANYETHMVNEFLVRLERFKGILILTTNNIENFDKAFLRRITVKLEFMPIHKDKILTVINRIIESEMLIADYDCSNIHNELNNLTLGMIGNVLKQKNFFEFYKTSVLVDKLKEEIYMLNKENSNPIGFNNR